MNKKSSDSQVKKKKNEASSSASKQNNYQTRSKIMQEPPSSESDEVDSNYVECLETYDPNKEYTDSSASDSKDVDSYESRKENPGHPVSDLDFQSRCNRILCNKNFA
ncbi:hypothetical protein QL285_095966 [Trifolium repens]|nr:hypothetical protein QL285_095966 [Trifolium repens]